MSSAEEGTPPLQALLDAVNANDVDAIMSFFTDDCVFDTPRGPPPGGHRLVAKQQIRKGFQARFDGIPDIDYGDDRHWTFGDRGVSEWTIRGTKATGESVEVRGATCSSSPTARSAARTRSGRLSTETTLDPSPCAGVGNCRTRTMQGGSVIFGAARFSSLGPSSRTRRGRWTAARVSSQSVAELVRSAPHRS